MIKNKRKDLQAWPHLSICRVWRQEAGIPGMMLKTIKRINQFICFIPHICIHALIDPTHIRYASINYVVHVCLGQNSKIEKLECRNRVVKN